MAYSGNGGTKILLCLGLIVLVSSFCRCSPLTRLKALDKLRDNSTLGQGQATGNDLRHGRLLIGQKSLYGAKLKGIKATKSLLEIDTDYQADMGWVEPKHLKGQGEGFSMLRPDAAAVERLLKMEPKVECTVDSMKLQVQDVASTQGSLLFVDRGSRLSPLPLSKLPPNCGYTVRSTQKDLVLVAPYDGCFVAHEEDCYVLPLRWCGVPVKMSCPLMRPSTSNPPMVTCHTEGMVVKTEWTVSVTKIKINLNGNWEPLMTASPRCGFSVVVHPEGVVISVHYAPCLEKKDGLYTLELAGDGEIKISCPSLSAPQTETPSKGGPPPTPSHNFGPAQSPQPALPQFPGFPQNPEAPNEKLNQGPKDINQPQLPYYPFYPHFFHPQPDTKPPVTVQPLHSPVTKKNGLQSQHAVHPSNLPVAPEGQVPQPFIPLPFHPWPAQPEHVPVEKEPPIQASAAPIPNGRWGNPFYPYPYNVKPPNTNVPSAHRPEPKPLPTSSPPVVQSTKGQRKQPYYPFPFYPQPPKPETPPTQAPVTKPPPGKLDEHVIPNPFNPPPGPPQKPVQPPVSQPEKHKPFNPFPPYLQPPPSEDPQVKQPLQPLYPETPGKPLPEKTVPPKPPVSQEPQGQIYQPFYHYPFHHPFWPQGPFQTHMPPAQRTPTPAPKGQVQQSLSPLQPEASKPQVPGNLLPSKPASERKEPSQPEAPQGQVHQYPYPLYPYPLYPQPEPTEKPTTVQQPPQQPGAPQGQVHQYPYPLYPHPLYPQPEPTEKPTTVQQPPQQPGAPRGQVHQYPYPLYPHPLYPQPEPTEKPTTVQQPPQQPGAPWGQVHQPFYPFYPQPKPENQPVEKPVHKPSYQQPYKIPDAGTNGAKTATEKPVPSEKPPGVKPPDGQVYLPFNLYYPQQPQHPQPIILPPATSVQQPLPVTIAQPSNGGIFPQGPQPGSPHMPSLYCPQFCLSGFSNCCPQIAFHQHLHHIVPAGLGSKDTPPVYPALPFVPSLAYSGFGNGLGTAVLPQKSTEATTTQASTSAPTSPQASPLGNGKQPYFLPPDGNLAAPTSISKKPVNPQLPTYPYFVPNSQYPNWPYVPQSQMQNLPQSQSAADYNVLSNPQAPGNDPVNPLVQYKPYYIQPPGQQMSQPSPADMNNPSGPNLMYFTGQYQKKEHTANQQIKPRAKELQPLNMESSDSKGQMHPKVQSELDPFLIPYYMLQDAQASTYNSSQPQSFVSGSKKSTKHNQTVHPYSEPKSYLLLQHGPPGREPNSFHESSLPFRDLVDDANLQAQNLARHDSSKPQHPQNLNPPQDKRPDLKWLGKMANPLPGNVNYMPRPGDKSENVPSFVSALNDPHFLDLPQDPSFSSVHLKPEFPESLKDMWKPLMPLGSNQRIPAHVPGEAFQQRSAAADYQTNGLNQAIQREAGNQKQKQVALNVNKQFKQ